MTSSRVQVAIVDHGLGNLRSVEQACRAVGLSAAVTSDRRDILGAAAVILPGVGAFGDAMTTLSRLDLVTVLRDVAASSTPLVGICLGVQLLMRESTEFGQHQGLGIIDGTVERLLAHGPDGRALKVPQVGWNRVDHTPVGADAPMLAGVPDGAYMYFVHSYVVVPAEPVVATTTRYGEREFCSAIAKGSVFACQFHPERSGPAGIRMYANLARRLRGEQ